MKTSNSYNNSSSNNSNRDKCRENLAYSYV